MKISHRTPLAAVLIVFASVGASLPTAAAAGDENWQIRLAAVSMNPRSGTVEVPGSDEVYAFNSSNGTGFAIDLEYRPTRRFGINFGVMSASPAIEATVGEDPFSVSARADLRVTPISAALNIHLTPDRTFDLYVGPVVAYVVYESFDLVAGPGLEERFSAENDFAFGGVVGLDITLGDGGWALSAAVRYLDTTLEATPSDGSVGLADLDPTIFSLGVGYRF